MKKLVRSRLGGSLAEALLAWFPFLVVFLMMPLNIYFTNQIDFGYNHNILLPFLGAAVLSLIAMFGLSLLHRGLAPKIVYALFFLGLFFVLSDTLVPLQWGLMDGTELLREAGSSIAIQVALAIVLTVGWFVLPRSVVKGFGLPLVLVVLAWQMVMLIQIVVKQPTHMIVAAEAEPATSGQVEKRPNVYHIVFDGYSSLLFLKAAEQTKFTEELHGFTFFQNNMSNYPTTDASLPSFLTGHLFKGGSFKEFQVQAKVSGLRKELQKAGYEISIYAPNKSRFWMYNGASYVYTSEDLSIGNKNVRARLAQMAFVRIAPEVLRRDTLRLTNKIFFGRNADYGYYKRLSVPLMERFLADEVDRPNSGQYVYLHVILPHPPYVWDGDCRMKRKTNFEEQTLCATKLMKDFVTKLKQLGRYEDSLVILQSDHGRSGIDADLVFKAPPSKVRDKVNSWRKYLEVDSFFLRLHSLLLIKAPASDAAPLRVSKQASQLADIPETVYRTLGLTSPPNDGHSVFALDEVKDREISVFPGARAITRERRHRATLGHLGYNADRGWSVHPDIEATHEGW